jgi:hypothetical protein
MAIHWRAAMVVVLTATTGLVVAGCAPPPDAGGHAGSTVQLTIGSEPVTVSVPVGRLTVTPADPGSLPAAPAGVSFPIGALNIDIANVPPNSVATVTITLTNAVDSVRKLIGGVWDPFTDDGTTGASVSADGKTITVRVQDGGRGDNDNAPNGTVVDPVAPTTGPAPFVAGCYDSSIDGMVDIGFNGAINTLDNGAALNSTNGSCTDGAYAYFTLVRATGHAAQLAACKALNPDFDSVFGFTPGSTTPVIPPDVAYCKRTLL